MVKRGFDSSRNSLYGKRGAGQPSGTPFIVFLIILIVIYIIVLPPEDREALLDGDTSPSSSSSGSSGSGKTTVQLLADFSFTGPGEMSELSHTEYEYEISPFYLYGDYEAEVLVQENDFTIYRSVFSGNTKQVDFYVENLDLLENPLLTFNLKKGVGMLTIAVNGYEIFSGEIDSYNSEPLYVKEQYLRQGNNVVTFAVNSPGFSFWQRNEYQISGLKVQGDIIDKSNLGTEEIFELRAVEIQNLESAKLRFFPDCETDDDGKLTAYINDEVLFSKIPDCGVLNVVRIPPSMLNAGQNTLAFGLEYGGYLVDRIDITTQLKDDEGVTYYFELDKDLFSETIETKNVCGEVDGICPEGCHEDLDKDCCFESYTSPYWCDIPTSQTSDRCVGHIASYNINRCPAGYEDDNGDVYEDFEGMCGDDNDGICPAGCSATYDKDCCLYDDSEQYWCDDLPIGGVTNICKVELTTDECSYCPYGYEGESSSPASCSYASSARTVDDVDLLSDYEVTATFSFVDDSKTHQAEVNVNGYGFTIDTRNPTYEKEISQFVVDNSNYIQVIPKSSFSLVQVEIDVDER